MAKGWSARENEKVVTDYFEMLSLELRGVRYTKADHWRRLQRVLEARTKGAIEKKHANISAILHELGYPSISGYQPYHNYQQELAELVAERLDDRRDIVSLVAKDANRRVVLPHDVDALSALTLEAARARKARTRRTERSRPPVFGGHVDYLERQARNASLGTAGEELVVRFEQQRLAAAGRDDLAARVDHVAITQGPSAGFDVRSFDDAGTELLIEVKTTTWGRETPFYVTANERLVSDARADRYHLYRLFDFRSEPQVSARHIVLRGSLTATCELVPTVYRGTMA